MHNYHLKSLFILTAASITLLFASCAQIVTPTGGDKDYTAPEVVSINPENNSTYFNKKKISIHFNEFIQLNTPEDLIIISPPLETKPTYTNKGKTLEIKFNSQPLPNTTYNINFGTAIGDNKENNLFRNFNYSFSTGPFLDSGMVAGTITSAFTNKPEKDITVALYYADSFTDSTIVKKKPVYLSKTEENGSFKIINLPPVLFHIIAFKDDNKNLKADKGESLSFTENRINPADTNSIIKMRLFKPDPFNTGKITDTFNRYPNKFTMVTYKFPVNSISNVNGNPVYVNKQPVGDADTMHVFTKMNAGDTAVNFLVNQQAVTIHYKPIFKAEKLNVTLNKQPELNDTIIFHFNNPVLKADTSRIKLYKDSIRVYPKQLLTSAFEYRVIYTWSEKTNYSIEAADSAFVDFYDQYSKKEKATFTAKSQKDYGTLLLHVKAPKKNDGQIILQFTDESEKSIYKEFIINTSKDISIDYIIPGNYRIKYIYDTNSNGKWDNGDFTGKKQPERVGYFNETLNIKAYWDLEQSVLIE
jgi:uncharacterized protein (DUF2141 family)